MKKLILVFSAIVITAGVFAQTDSTNRKMRPADINNTDDGLNPNRDMNNNQNRNIQNNSDNNSHVDGVMMQDEKMMMVKNGQLSVLDHEMTMRNGTKILSDGTYIKKDGTKMVMKEGQHIDMSGNLIPMKTNHDKDIYLVPDSTKKNEN